ncbi:outer membrane protein assembly factor BamB family protein [Halocatena pleomorpha]|uniref:Pyrrolo-quinoline quinone repeat domain-containing protein n=1 Tax=Halocatena pleomorpha TaxID=1785090 RepID=A0A3P3RD78_9EURY|nr:PQQ-binding-like beta-propeller repeat protein [Halocatena pleomorpha]RRJ30899.1 hypothetical protein EIK79_08760 [Halocatena pleomorpha]
MKSQKSLIGRRSFLSGAAAAVVGAGVALGASDPIQAQPEPTGEEHWNHPRGNAASTAFSTDGVGPTGSVSIAWEGWSGGYHSDMSVKAVVDGMVYVTDSSLSALDAADGTELWEFRAEIPDREFSDTPAAAIESATVMDGVVYAPVRIGAYDSENIYRTEHTAVVAVDAETGDKLWRRDAPVAGMFSTVTAVDGSLFVCGPDFDSGEGRFVYALDANDGSVRWRQPIAVESEDSSPPVVTDESVFVAPDNGVTAYNAATGDIVWEALPRVKDLSVAMISDGTLFVNENTEPGATIIALDAASGDERWKTSYGGDVRVDIGTVDMERLYVSTSEDTDVIALNRTDGSEAWRATIPQPPIPPENPPAEPIPAHGMARVGKLLYVGGAGLKPSDGSIVWKQGIEGPWIAGYWLDAVAGGRVYLSGDSLVVMEGAKIQTGTSTAQSDTEQPDDTVDKTT